MSGVNGSFNQGTVVTNTIAQLEPFIDSSAVPKERLVLRFLCELGAFSLVLFIGLLLIAFTIGARIVFSLNVGTFRTLIYAVLNVVWAFVFVFLVRSFVRLRRRARVYTPLTLEKVGTRDPILYLRSFYEDESESIWRADLKSSEEVLVSALKEVGPFIAVGDPKTKEKPNQAMPHLGGLRIFFKKGEWQEKVKHLMTISQFVVIDTGFSSGLQWEVGTAVSTVHPQKLILSFLSWDSLDGSTRQSLYESFAKDFKERTGMSLPERLGKATFILFDANWTSHLIEINAARRFLWGLFSMSLVSLFGDASALALKESLRPALGNRGFNLKFSQEVLYVSLLIVLPIVMSLMVLLTTLIEIRLLRLSI